MNIKKLDKFFYLLGQVTAMSQSIEYNLSLLFAYAKVLDAFKDNNSMVILKFNDLLKSADKEYKILIKKTVRFC